MSRPDLTVAGYLRATCSTAIRGQPVTIYGNGAQLALPIVGFILGSYWNDYYRDRPWYRSQNQWNTWRPATDRHRAGVHRHNRRPPVVDPAATGPPVVRPPWPPVVQPQPPRPPRPIPMPKPQ